MPSKNVIKIYLDDGFYHVYNRGVDKRVVFADDLDYKMFLSYLKNYLVPPYEGQPRPRRKSDLHEKIQLIAYCLMPNHFHMLIKQTESTAITRFMRSITNAYTRYFNQKNSRVGPLFQGKYKAILVTEEPYLLHLSRYIHLNPFELFRRTRSDLVKYSYSSYGEYLGKRKTSWVHPEEILAFFGTARRTSLKNILSYQSFVEEYVQDPKEAVGEIALD